MKTDTVPRLSMISACLLSWTLLGAAAQAQDRPLHPAFQNRPKSTPVQALAECTCRAMGADFRVGSEACINNARMRCVMDQNVTSWQRLDDGCPQS